MSYQEHTFDNCILPKYTFNFRNCGPAVVVHAFNPSTQAEAGEAAEVEAVEAEAEAAEASLRLVWSTKSVLG